MGVCVGPLLFDLACCAIGCCFHEDADDTHDNASRLDMQLLEAFLDGYCNHRALPAIEREHFVAFMRLTLLCNCCWRFVKFNITDRDNSNTPDEAKNSYLELQRRIEHLDSSGIAGKINRIIEEWSRSPSS